MGQQQQLHNSYAFNSLNPRTGVAEHRQRATLSRTFQHAKWTIFTKTAIHSLRQQHAPGRNETFQFINFNTSGNEIQKIFTDQDTQIQRRIDQDAPIQNHIQNVPEYSVILQAHMTHEEGILVALKIDWFIVSEKLLAIVLMIKILSYS